MKEDRKCEEQHCVIVLATAGNIHQTQRSNGRIDKVGRKEDRSSDNNHNEKMFGNVHEIP